MFLPSNITLQFGDSGDFVAELQRRLSLVNCFDEAMINGFYDGATVTGVTSFQGRNGLHADGVAGPETLRRLNGVISGDTSSTTSDSKKEEEAKREQAHAQLQKDQLIIEQLSPAAYAQPVQQEQPAPTSAPAITAAPAVEVPPTQAPAVDPQAQQREQILRAEAIQQQAPTPNQNDMLAQMLLQQNRPQPQQEQQTSPHQRVPGQPPGQLPPGQLPPGQLPPELQKPAPKPIEQTAPTPPIEKPVASVAPVASTEPEKPKGIIGRAIQAANSMIDKLGAYFESKLPPSVLNEVKAIGATMAKSGMKETEIPAGPELPTRAQELPGREQPAQAQAVPQRRQ